MILEKQDNEITIILFLVHLTYLNWQLIYSNPHTLFYVYVYVCVWVCIHIWENERYKNTCIKKRNHMVKEPSLIREEEQLISSQISSPCSNHQLPHLYN